MILLNVARDSQGRVLSLFCSGHAEFSDEEHGGDIVCAAVSALTGYLGITMSEVLEFPDSVSAEDGVFRLQRPGLMDEARQATLDVLLEGFVRAMRGLEENYSGWVKLEETEF